MYACVRGLSEFKGACSGPVRPYLKISEVRPNVHQQRPRFLWLTAAFCLPRIAVSARGFSGASQTRTRPRRAPLRVSISDPAGACATKRDASYYLCDYSVHTLAKSNYVPEASEAPEFSPPRPPVYPRLHFRDLSALNLPPILALY